MGTPVYQQEASTNQININVNTNHNNMPPPPRTGMNINAGNVGLRVLVGAQYPVDARYCNVCKQ